MQAFKDMLGSERAIFAVALVTGATVLAATRNISADQWLDFAQYLATVYIGSKTVTGAVEVWGRTRREELVLGKVPEVAAPAASVSVNVNPDKNGQGGFVRCGVLALLAVVGVAAACSALSSGAREVADGVVDCTKRETAKVVAELGPLADAALVDAVEGDKVNWSPVKQLAARFSADVGGCLLADAIGRALAPLRPGAPKSSPLDVAEPSLREGLAALKVQLNVTTFRTKSGDL